MEITTKKILPPFPGRLKTPVQAGKANAGIDENSFIPEVPSVGEGIDRLVHSTGGAAKPIFEKGLPIGLGINCHTRTYGNSQIPLVNSNNEASFCDDIGYFRQTGTYSSGNAIVIDMPRSIHKHFRVSGEDLIPREYIRGAVERSGNWIPNPHYDLNYIHTPEEVTKTFIPPFVLVNVASMVPRPNPNLASETGVF